MPFINFVHAKNFSKVFRRFLKTNGSFSNHLLQFVPDSHQVSQYEVAHMSKFINSCSKVFVITGAGVSTESGIKDYRSEKVGLYATSKQRPIEYLEFLKNPNKRQKYWARNYLAWPIFSSFQPNVNHHFLSAMEKHGNLHWLVTQNVDSLHLKAGSVRVTELHGSSARVVCLTCGNKISRFELQKQLQHINSNWRSISSLNEQGPDGDVFISESDANQFKMVDCHKCGGILKPEIVFFGDNVSPTVKELCCKMLSECDGVLVIGSSLQVYSSFRFIIAAKEKRIPITILNIGETRGDPYAYLKLPYRAGEVLPKLSLKWMT